MYPAQTSLIPVQVALARFLEQGGNILGNYPYWYLGTTPYRYLTGPVLPTVLVGLHQILPGFSLFEIMLGLIGTAWVVGGFGIYWLVRELKGEKGAAVFSAVFYTFGPIIPFLFRFSNGLYLIAFSFLPLTLLWYFRLLKKWERKTSIICITLITFLILLDTLIIPTLIFGMAAIFLAQAGWKRAEEKLKKSVWLMVYSVLLATLWYAPGYWLTLLGAPSLAGKGLVGVMVWLGKLLPAALAFGIAIASVKFFKKRNLLRDFCFYWLFIFGCLTLLRFLSDPDFWLDWTSYGMELQFGLAIAGGILLSRASKGKRKLLIPIAYCLLLLSWLFITNNYALGTLQPNIAKAVEYRIGKQLEEIVKPGERVFLSGTTAFWLNVFWNIPQVRGGADQVSVDPNWRQAVWEIRAGDDPKKSVRWLKMLKIAYLVVHTKDSEEFYHDFVYPEKFEGVGGLEKVYEERGDRIYKLED
jgi:hypothetical protein